MALVTDGVLVGLSSWSPPSAPDVEQLLADLAWRDRFAPGEAPRPLDQARTCPRCGAAL